MRTIIGRRPLLRKNIRTRQDLFVENLGRHLVHAADEYYLAAGREFPAAQSYGDFEMFEDGIGMASAFELEFTNHDFKRDKPSGFFASVDGAPPLGFRAPRSDNDVEDSILIDCSLHVPRSLALTFTIPLASISKVTSI